MGANLPTARCRGVTLTELLVVVIILGLLAAVAAPGLRSADPAKLDLAATQIAEAIRFARSEAMRTGQVHSVLVKHQTEEVNADKTDLTTQPPSAEYLLHHPISRQLYEFNVSTARTTAGIEITNTQEVFDFSGISRRRRLMFDAQGKPIFIRTSTGETYHLAVGQILLGYGTHQRIVQVDPYTGRVTIQ